MERYSDEAIRILDDLHTERLDYHSEYLPLIDAAQRLDAYESTGMEPEDILNATDMAKVACALRELNQYKELGDLDRLRELVRADREGRCPVMPCKIGDELWTFCNYPRKMVYSLMVVDISVQYQRIKVYTDKIPVFDGTDIGKTVFLSREAAEKALEKEENRNG